MIRGLELLAPRSPILREGDKDGRLNLLLVVNDLTILMISSTQTQKEGVWRASALMNMWRYGESDAPGGALATLCPFPRSFADKLFHLVVPELYPFIINQ